MHDAMDINDFIGLFEAYRDTAVNIECIDIVRALQGKPSIEELLRREEELDN